MICEHLGRIEIQTLQSDVAICTPPSVIIPSMNATNYQRLPHADAARALAISLVVILHIVAALVEKGYAVGKFNWWIANLVDSVARIGVPLFVLVSGTLLLDPHRNESLATFFQKRFVKVLIPLLGWSVIYLAWRIYYEGDHFTLQQAFRAILENTVAYHFWFLYMILGLYLVTPVLRVFTRIATPKDYKYFLIIWVLAVCLPAFLRQFFGIAMADFWLIVIGFSGYYVGGYFLNQERYSEPSFRWARALYLIALSITILGSYLLLRHKGEYDPYFYEYLSPNVIVMSLAAYFILRWLPYEHIYARLLWLNRLVAILCVTSFGVYMVHVLLLSVLKGGRLGFVLSGASIGLGFGILATFLVVMPISVGIVYLMQRIPVLKNLVP
jgi:surface polysaccharide O-acyltransferase-like enzyme